jgi:hypothetical protein
MARSSNSPLYCLFRFGLVLPFALSVLGCDEPVTFSEGEPGGAGSDTACQEDKDCDDHDFCNGEEQCDPGSKAANQRGCVPSTRPIECDDDIPCTLDACSNTLERCVFAAPDADDDGYADAACLNSKGEPLGNDCDDNDQARSPGNLEVCDDADQDEDCDLGTVGSRDEDGDGAISDNCCNGDKCGDDCNDENVAVRPFQPEFCDEIDNNCDGKKDNDTSAVLWYPDEDGDGFGSIEGKPQSSCEIIVGASVLATDCNDNGASVHPAAAERCADSVDNNCNGLMDEGPECEIPEGTSVCAEDRTSCGSACVNIATDERFCGSCFVSCKSAERCEKGECTELDGAGGGSGTGGTSGTGGAGGGGGNTAAGGGSGVGGQPNQGATAILFHGRCLPVCDPGMVNADADGVGNQDGADCVVEDSSAFTRGLPCTGATLTSLTEAEWTAAAASVDWTEDFAVDSLPEGWDFEGDFTSGKKAFSEAPDAFTTDALAGTGLTGPYTSDVSRILLRWIDVPKREKLPYLRYRYWYSLSAGDEVRVELRTDDDAPWVVLEDVTGTISHFEGSNPIWTQGMIPLELLAEQRVQISFVLESSGNGQNRPGFFIDRVKLSRGQMAICGCQGFHDPPGEEDGSNDWSVEGGQWGIGVPHGGAPAPKGGTTDGVQGAAGTNLFGPYQALSRAPRARLVSPTKLSNGSRHDALFNESFALGAGAQVQIQIREVGGPWQNLGATIAGPGNDASWWGDEKRKVSFDAFANKVIQFGFLFHNGGGAPNSSGAAGYYVDEFEFP